MLRGRGKLSSKLAKKSAFPARFSCNQPSLSFFSPPWPPAATTDLVTVLPTKHHIPSITQQPHHSHSTSLSTSLLCKTFFFPLHHRNSSSRSSGNHPLQRLSLLPAAARVASPSSVTPTAPAVSFPSPLQESAPSSSSREQCKPPASPPSVTPCTTS